MKPHTPRLSVILAWGLVLAASAAWNGSTQAVETPTPTAGAKVEKDKGTTPKPPKERKAKSIQFPVPKGDIVNKIKIPKLDVNGIVLQLLSSGTMENLDDEHVVMRQAKVDLFHPDGKEDFHVVLPESTLNLKTNIITSDHPVTVSTDDFELTGERMQFNTVDRTGELQGHVHMVIRNFKQVGGAILPTPAP